MMYIDYEANTEREAIQLALESLGLSEAEVRVEVLEREKRGLFGLGKKEKAKVRIYYKEREGDTTDLEDVLKMLVGYLDPRAKASTHYNEKGDMLFEVDAEDPSILIGKHARVLGAIQQIFNAMLMNRGSTIQVKVDVDQYYKKRYASMVRRSVSIAKGVAMGKKSALLDPMNSYERRLVHLEIARRFRNVRTESQGEGKMKRIKLTQGAKE